MKDKALIYLSLVISITALCYAAWLHRHSAQLAEEALQKREQQFVQALAPKLQQIYRGFGVTNVVATPRTLDELFGPYLATLNRTVNQTAADEKKTP